MSNMSVFGLLFRYFAKQHLAWTSLAVFSLTVIVSIIQTVELIRRVGVLKNNQKDVNFFILSLMNLPTVIDVVLPFAILSGSMLCFHSYNKTNEFVITRGMGTSIWSALSPALTSAFCVGLFFVMAINPIGSFTAKQYDKQMVAIFGTDDRNLSVTAEGIWLRDRQKERQLIIHGDALDAENVSIINPVVYLFEDPNGLKARLRGSEMLLTDAGWMIENTFIWENDGSSRDLGTMMLSTNIGTLDIERSTEPPHTIPVYTLQSFIQMLKSSGLPAVNHSIHFHQLLALPLLMVGVTMLAARFTLSNVNRSTRMHLFTRGVLIATGIFVYGYLLQVLGSSYRVPPVIAGWAPAITILLTGATLLARLDES